MSPLNFRKNIIDEVGYWTEIKLSILRDYAAAYAKIMNRQQKISYFAYIDGFAGAGTHISRSTGQRIEGSPLIALKIQPPFSYYHFIDMDGKRAEQLRQLAAGKQNFTVYEGDCNSVLLREVFPKCRYEDYRRALCLLDPYGLNPNWEVVFTAGRMKSIEIFLNFMIMDANRNILWGNPDKVQAAQVDRMNAFWGEDSWRKSAYTREAGLFGEIEQKACNEAVVNAYRKRLKEIAKFKYVPKPIPMKNSKGITLYYLFFASHNGTGDKIARAIFKKYGGERAANG